jgi:hypothetical protein
MKTSKSLSIVTISIVISSLLFSCGATDKAKETANNLSALKDMADNISKTAESMNDKQAERKAKGDTLAMPYKDLQAFLPTLSGYEKVGEPEGESMNMTGMSFSVASQKYKKGEEAIKVSITDYNAAYSAFMGVTALMNAGFSVENDNEISHGVDLGIAGIKGFETIKKKNKSGNLIVAVADRFFISIDGNNIGNPDVLKEIAKGISLNSLASK